MSDSPYILTINSGSSSFKFALFAHPKLTKVFEGKIDRVGMDGTYLETYDIDTKVRVRADIPSNETPNSVLKNTIHTRVQKGTLTAVGHRVVHGGNIYTETTLIDDVVIHNLKKLISFAPRHLPPEIAAIELLRTEFPATPQFACFDTSFFCDLPRIAKILPIPRSYQEKGIERYGFHGLSYEYLIHYLTEVLHEHVSTKKIILAHLGSGASLTAVSDGNPVDTTMGFTPNSGTPMGTRSGDIDPGFFEYLAHEEKLSPEQISHLLNYESGTKGVSGSTADMELLLTQTREDRHAEEAVAFFCYHVRKHIGALSAAMGGVDMLVFTGGIGQRSAEVRRRICSNFEYLGISLNEVRNASSDVCISSKESRVILYVIPTDEEYMIARHVEKLYT